MKIIKSYSYKHAEEILTREHPHLLRELTDAIHSISAVRCLTKESDESSKIKAWGGLLFSPSTINAEFKSILYPLGWAKWDEKKQKYSEHTLTFNDGTTRRGNDRLRKIDGIKERVGLEIQMGKYAFMGYDIFSKMIIFKNKDLIDYGVEIVLVQKMIDRMSTGVSAFEHIMIDFNHRGEADIDIPVFVLGIGPTESEWPEVDKLQKLYRDNPASARALYPKIGKSDLKGSKPGPK
jgi:Restriction endonuclease BglII